MRNFGVLLPFYIFLFGCSGKSDYLVHDIPPLQEKSLTLHELRNVDNKVDILFVVDNSGSMGTIQQNIIDNAKLFMQEFLKNNYLTWQMGIVSTDKTEDPFLGFSRQFDTSLLLRNNGTMSADEMVKLFEDSIKRLGTSGSASEYVFYNVLRPMISPVNKSFFRHDAHLAVIMVTDEKEQSVKKFGAQYEPLTYLNTLKSMKGPNKQIRFYGAFNFKDLKDCKTSGWNRPSYEGSPFQEIINETSGIYMSACELDFGKGLAKIGEDIVSIVDSPSILLSERPKMKSLEVFYDDIPLPSGKRSEGGVWFYSEKYNTINFYHLDFAPDFVNSKIKITFDIRDGVDREDGEDGR